MQRSSLPNQIAVPNERSSTDVTFIILSAAMRANMNGKLSFTRECHGTAITA